MKKIYTTLLISLSCVPFLSAAVSINENFNTTTDSTWVDGTGSMGWDSGNNLTGLSAGELKVVPVAGSGDYYYEDGFSLTTASDFTMSGYFTMNMGGTTGVGNRGFSEDVRIGVGNTSNLQSIFGIGLADESPTANFRVFLNNGGRVGTAILAPLGGDYKFDITRVGSTTTLNLFSSAASYTTLLGTRTSTDAVVFATGNAFGVFKVNGGTTVGRSLTTVIADNLSLNQVPEPSSMAMLGVLGMFSTCVRRRR